MTTIIESLTDRDAYVSLGAINATPGATDDETVTWALEATRASVADTATDEDRAQILAWVREGERETAERFIAQCVARAPDGWSAAAAIRAAAVLAEGSSPMGAIICARSGVYLAVQGYPSRRDEETGAEFWDDPSAWVMWLSSEEQREELSAAI